MPSLASTKRCPPRSQSGTRFLLFPGPRFYPLVNSAFWGPISSGAPSGLFFLKTSEAPDGALEKQAAGCTQEGEWGPGKKKIQGLRNTGGPCWGTLSGVLFLVRAYRCPQWFLHQQSHMPQNITWEYEPKRGLFLDAEFASREGDNPAVVYKN